MMRLVAITVLSLISTLMLHAQSHERVVADTVFAFQPGTGQSTGQSGEFFPSNIFGIPDPTATESAPSVNPREICSIGLGGEIIIGFQGYEIVDGDGADFIIYENAFFWGEGRTYREPARVEVSVDGIKWIAFPFDSTTLLGCAGKTPTTGGDPFDSKRGGGDAFDLADVGVEEIRWVKIIDITQMILDNPQHPDYDPTLTGFDLDAIVSPHGRRFIDQSSASVIPRSSIVQLEVASASAEFEVFDVSGRLLWQETLSTGTYTRDLQFLPVAVALAWLRDSNQLFPVKVLR